MNIYLTTSVYYNPATRNATYINYAGHTIYARRNVGVLQATEPITANLRAIIAGIKFSHLRPGYTLAIIVPDSSLLERLNGINKPPLIGENKAEWAQIAELKREFPSITFYADVADVPETSNLTAAFRGWSLGY